MWLLVRAVRVLIESEIGVPIVRLGILVMPRCDFRFVNQNSVGVMVDRAAELVQNLLIVVFGNPGIQTIVPVVNAANEVVAIHEPVRHERTAVETPSVKNRYLVIKSHHNQVDICDKRIGRLTIFKIAPRSDFERK
jgi:hypothetical protein